MAGGKKNSHLVYRTECRRPAASDGIYESILFPVSRVDKQMFDTESFLGLGEHTRVGSPLFMAPEILLRQEYGSQVVRETGMEERWGGGGEDGARGAGGERKRGERGVRGGEGRGERGE